MAEGKSVNLTKSLDERYTDKTSWNTSVHADNYTKSGMYSIGNNATGFPDNYGLLLVIAPRDDTFAQLYMAGANIYYRGYRSGSWSSWKSL